MRSVLSGALAICAICLCVTASMAQTVTVCDGEYEKACQAHEAYVYCGQTETWATSFCKGAGLSGAHQSLRLNTYGGNKCGYAITRIICQ